MSVFASAGLDLISRDTLQGRLIEQGFRLPPEPVTLSLRDGSVREGEVTYLGGPYGIEMRLMSEGASSLGLGATVNVYLPEVGWIRSEPHFSIKPARVSHSSSSSDADDPGWELEASIFLLTLAREIRDQLNDEAEEALGPYLADLIERDRVQEANDAENDRRRQAVVSRLRSFLLYGSRVRVTGQNGSRISGTLLDDGRPAYVTVEAGGKKKVIQLADVTLFEVLGPNGRFRPFELGYEEVKT